jgi:hypothetical protein
MSAKSQALAFRCDEQMSGLPSFDLKRGQSVQSSKVVDRQRPDVAFDNTHRIIPINPKCSNRPEFGVA